MSEGSCPNGGNWYVALHPLLTYQSLIYLGTLAQIKPHSSAAAHLTHATAQDVPQATFEPRAWAQEAVPTPPQMMVHTIKMNNVHLDNGGHVQTRLPPFKVVA